MIAGGFDDISEEGSYEFVNMKSTSTEFAMGREPTEMSRPTKVICDNFTYLNKAWSIVGQGMFQLWEVNQMEREMC
jgi:hypothetical protein